MNSNEGRMKRFILNWYLSNSEQPNEVVQSDLSDVVQQRQMSVHERTGTGLQWSHTCLMSRQRFFLCKFWQIIDAVKSQLEKEGGSTA
jgi:hypothetical protein